MCDESKNHPTIRRPTMAEVDAYGNGFAYMEGVARTYGLLFAVREHCAVPAGWDYVPDALSAWCRKSRERLAFTMGENDALLLAVTAKPWAPCVSPNGATCADRRCGGPNAFCLRRADGDCEVR